MADAGIGKCNLIPEIIYHPIVIHGSGDKDEEPAGKCPVCLRFGRYFYCSDCVRNGDFTHSKKKCFERFADKKLKKYKLNEKKSAILQRYSNLLSKQIKAENLNSDISLCKENIRFLKERLRCCGEEISKGQKLIEDLSVKKNAWNITRSQYTKKIESMKSKERKWTTFKLDRNSELASIHSDLQNAVQVKAHKLISDIFTITKVEAPKHKTNSPEEDQWAELKEAQQTTYVKGHWVLSGSSSDESEYCVVEPCLPGNGDYSAYVRCSKNIDGLSLTQKEQYEHYVAFGISAALNFTAQLVSALTFYLDAYLPKPLTYSEFCGPELEKEEFLHKVAKLNAGIIHLCLSQNVDLSLIRPHQTIPNLLLLLDPSTSDLGRFEAFEMEENAIQPIEVALSKDLLSIDESDFKNCDDTEYDWVKISDAEEDVPTSPTQIEAMSSQPSFISSVASFWRAATGHK